MALWPPNPKVLGERDSTWHHGPRWARSRDHSGSGFSRFDGGGDLATSIGEDRGAASSAPALPGNAQHALVGADHDFPGVIAKAR